MKKTTVLIVDDEPSIRTTVSEALLEMGYDVDTAADGVEAINKFEKKAFEVVITDVKLPKVSGMEVLRGIKSISTHTPVIVMTGYGTVNTAVEAMKEGASDFIMKPFSAEHLELVIKDVISKNGSGAEKEGRAPSGSSSVDKAIVTGDERMLSLLKLLKNVSGSSSGILIQGESGTGKELLARYVHRYSKRSKKPFVAVNCAAIPHQLLESEMFGYEKGAFTGASMRKLGKFELATGGTLLLDEISEMDIQLQAKLLRVIQESEVDRLGANGPVSVDTRIIATTNTDLKKRIEEKTFREDLYYRINVIPVKVPPLRERNSDIAVLAEHFLQKYSERNEIEKPALSSEVIRIFEDYDWPGNVRELENVIERAVLMCGGSTIFPGDLCMENTEAMETVGEIQSDRQDINMNHFAGMSLREVEKKLIFETLGKLNGNRTRASKVLGISVRTMRNKLNEYKEGDV